MALSLARLLQCLTGTALDSPPLGYVNITPADVDLATPIRGFICGGAGTLVLTGIDGTVGTFNAAANVEYAAAATRVAAESTATGICGFY